MTYTSRAVNGTRQIDCHQHASRHSGLYDKIELRNRAAELNLPISGVSVYFINLSMHWSVSIRQLAHSFRAQKPAAEYQLADESVRFFGGLFYLNIGEEWNYIGHTNTDKWCHFLRN